MGGEGEAGGERHAPLRWERHGDPRGSQKPFAPRQGEKPEPSLSLEPLSSRTGTQGDTLRPSSGRLGASQVVGSGVLARGAAAQNRCPVLGAAHPCPSLACHLASAPLGTSWELPQVLGRCVVPDTQVRAVSGGQHMRLPGPAPAPESGWWEGSRPPDSKPPGLSVQTHQWSDFFCEDKVSTSQDEARANQTCCPRPGYGDLGSARCHPARQLWSWLVRGKPSRKHHQLRVRRARNKGCGGETAGGVCPGGT